MERRKFTHLILSCVSITVPAGCLSLSQDNSVDIRILNWSFEEEEFRVTIKSGGQVEYQKEVQIKAGEFYQEDNIISPGQYDVLVETSGALSRDKRLQIEGCKDQEVTINYQSQRELTIQTNEC